MEAAASQIEQPVRVQRPSGPGKQFLRSAGELTVFGLESLRELPSAARYASETLRQAAILVRGSTFAIIVMTSFIGFAQATVGYFFLRAAAASDLVGFFTGLTTPRAAAPVMFGYVFAAKVGCGMVAEIGVMRIGEEIDALESEAVNPMRYVVATRLAGALLFVPLAVAAALISVTLGSYVDTVLVLQALPSAVFWHDFWSAQNIADQFIALGSLGATAMAIVIVACFFGYRASGGPEGVGRAVAASLIVNLVLAHVIPSLFIGLFYGPNPHLPIGG